MFRFYATTWQSISLDGLAGRDLTSLLLKQRSPCVAVRLKPSTGQHHDRPGYHVGLQDRIGSIEIGKDADLLILMVNRLDYRSYVEKAMVNGKLVYDRPTDKILPVYDRN